MLARYGKLSVHVQPFRLRPIIRARAEYFAGSSYKVRLHNSREFRHLAAAVELLREKHERDTTGAPDPQPLAS